MYDGIKRRCVQCGEIYIDGSRVCPCCKCPTKREDGITESCFENHKANQKGKVLKIPTSKKGQSRKSANFKKGSGKRVANNNSTPQSLHLNTSFQFSQHHTVHNNPSQSLRLNVSNGYGGCIVITIVLILLICLIVGLIKESYNFCSSHSSWGVIWEFIKFPFVHPIWALVIYVVIGAVVCYFKEKV